MKATITAFFYFVMTLVLIGCSAMAPALPGTPELQPIAQPVITFTEANPATPPELPAPEIITTSQPSAQPEPTVLAPTPTPLPELRQLTNGGCCSQPFWSPDSQQILFIDRPSLDAPAGLWGVNLQGGAPQFVTDRLGIFSNDMQLRAFPETGQTVVERLSDGQRWIIPSSGRAISFSLDGKQVAWSSGQNDSTTNNAPRQIWVSQVDGSLARQVYAAAGAGINGWLPDGRLLVSERLLTPESGQILKALTLPDASASQPLEVELARGERLRGTSISPDGRWLAYLVTLSADPQQNGIWLVNTQSGEKRPLEIFGAYRWRDGSRLLVVPLDLEQTHHRLWQVNVGSNQAIALTDPGITPFKIANGDWSVSPDGRQVAFVSAMDYNIWLLTLPEN
jgi:Tol biopolymer transport system component